MLHLINLLTEIYDVCIIYDITNQLIAEFNLKELFN